LNPPQDANLPFIINLQVPTASSLNLADDPYANLVVNYGVKKVGAGGTFADWQLHANLWLCNAIRDGLTLQIYTKSSPQPNDIKS
jgi:hypothetical protein